MGLGVLAAFGLLILLLTGRSETVRGLTIGRDERFAQIDLKATAVAGLVLSDRDRGLAGGDLPRSQRAPVRLARGHQRLHVPARPRVLPLARVKTVIDRTVTRASRGPG